MKRFRTVMLTYLKRWQFWVCLVLWLCQVVGVAPALWRGRVMGRMLGGTMGFGVGYICAALGIHLKEQLGAYRATLMPHFRVPHIAAALVWMAVVVLPFPVTAAICGASVGGVGGPALLVAALGLSLFTRGGTYAVGAGLLYMGLFLPGTIEILGKMAVGDYLVVSLACLLAGLVILGSTVRFLLAMGEETPGYATQFRGNLISARSPQARRASFEAIRQLEEKNSVWLRITDWGMSEKRPCVADSRWRRILHWRRASANRWMPFLVPCMVWSTMAGTQIWMHAASLDAAAIFHTTMWVAVMMPQMLFVSAWQSRYCMLSREMTYPVRRQDIVLEQGLSILVSQLLSWGLLMAEISIVFAFFPDPLPGHFMLTLIVLTGSWQLLAFGVSARLAPLSTWVPLISAFVVNAGLGAGLLALCLQLYTGVLLACIVGIVLTLAAVSLFFAYDHWLKVDLP